MERIPPQFTQTQTQTLEQLFERFYELSCQVSFTAKATKMAIIAQNYSNHKLDDYDLELAFDNILKDIHYITEQSAEMSCNADYITWKNKDTKNAELT